jgi:hypothetical protein
MEDEIIAALLGVLILVTWGRFEEYKNNSFDSQIADLLKLNETEDGYNFGPSDYNQMEGYRERGSLAGPIAPGPPPPVSITPTAIMAGLASPSGPSAVPVPSPLPSSSAPVVPPQGAIASATISAPMTMALLKPPTSKKGFVYDLKINKAPNPMFNTQMMSLNLGWYYTWGLLGSPGLNIPFTPMVWGAPDTLQLAQIPPGSTEILGFNEPDGNQPGAQSNISIQTVVSLWPKLKASGLRVGSVAAAQDPLATSYKPNDGSPVLQTSYFDALWTALTAAGMQPDFIALHWYAPPDAIGFLNWIDKIYAKYNKPIWITEMCVADWNATAANPEKFTTAQIQVFMDSVAAGMNSRNYVERYCWKTRPTTDFNMGNGALIAIDGSLTPLGQHYMAL